MSMQLLSGILIGIGVVLFAVWYLQYIVDKSESEINYQLPKPHVWWVDKNTNMNCSPINHPVMGYDNLSYEEQMNTLIAIDKEYHDQCIGWWYAQACTMMDKGEDIRQVGLLYLVSKMQREVIGE